MLTKNAVQGALDACQAFGVDPEKLAGGAGPSFLSSLIPKAKAFGQGQWGAAKNLFHNVRGGLGGQFNPNVTGQGFTPPPGFNDELGRAMHRQQTIGNLKTLAPSLAVAGGLGYLHHRRNKQEQQAAQGQY